VDGTRTRAKKTRANSCQLRGIVGLTIKQIAWLDGVGATSGDVDEVRRAEPTDAELERAVVEAVMVGAIDVARTLATRLEKRRATPNVVDLDRERAKRRRASMPRIL
jgi:hypothetical protein